LAVRGGGAETGSAHPPQYWETGKALSLSSPPGDYLNNESFLGTLSILDLNIKLKFSCLVFTRRGSPVDKRHSPNHYKFGDLHTFEWGEFMCCDRVLRANILFNMQVICSVLGEMFIGFLENYESFNGQLI